MSDTTVPFGASSSGLTLGNGDNLYVFGAVTSTTVNAGGTEFVSSGGVASFTTVSSGGFDVVTGGTAISATVDSGGTQFVYSGGLASATTLTLSGVQTVYSGGATISTVLDGAGQYGSTGETVFSGGTATGTEVSNQGNLTVGTYGTAGGTATGTIVDDSGIAIAYAGGILIGTTVEAFGFLRVTGGVASFTTISANGGGEVDAGGVVSGTTISGGYFDVRTGGTASVTVVIEGGGGEQGSIRIGDAGLAVSTTISSGGYVPVTSGGIVVSSFIDSGGDQNVFSGGIASFTTVSGGGYENVGTGGTTISTTVSGTILIIDPSSGEFVTIGGFQQVSGGLASATQVTSDGFQTISSGGVAIGTTVSSAGTQSVGSGGTAEVTTISGGGQQYLFSGGLAVSVTIDSGGQQYVASGGSAGFVTISAGGTQTVGTGGNVSGVLVSGNITWITSDLFTGDTGFQIVTGGIAVDTVVDAGNDYFDAVQLLTAGGEATGTIVESGGFEVVTAGGVASATTVDSGGYLRVTGGGLAIGAIVSDGGSATLSAGGVATATTVDSGGFLVISAGGSAVGTVVSDGGSATVSAGGLASATVVDSGGYQVVSNGGLASATVVDSGGYQVVSNGGLASATVVDSGGYQVVSRGGLASATMVRGGTELVTNGGSAGFTMVSSGGDQIVAGGGATLSTTVSGGGRETVSGGTASATTIAGGSETAIAGAIVSATVVGSGGDEIAGSGGSALATQVTSGGIDHVDSGGTATGTTLSAGGLEVVSGGIASGTTVQSAGAEFVSSGGTTISTIVSSGGGEFVFSGGDAEATAVSAGGYVVVLPGGLADTVGGGITVSTGIAVWSPNSGTSAYAGATTGLVVNDGDIAFVLPGGSAVSAAVTGDGTLNVVLGGSVTATVLSGGGALNVSSGGTASGTIISGGGSETAFSGGTVSATAVDSGGTENVSSGAIVSGTTVNSGGTEEIWAGGGDDATTVSAFGTQMVNSGGSASFATIASGGVQIVASGGLSLSGAVDSGGVATIASGGSASFTTVSSGGAELVRGGGSVTSATVSAGGFLVVLPGGTQSGTTGAGEIVSSGVVLEQPGAGISVFANFASGIAVGSGATEYVLTNGIALSGMIGGGGSAIVDSGGTASADAVDSGGTVLVASGGIAVGLTISDGEAVVSSGGAASGTLVGSGAAIVLAGGSAGFTVVSSGGTIEILSGGHSLDATIGSGGTATVSFGGTASATLLDGGTQSVFGKVSGTTVNGGGEVVYAGGIASGTSIGGGAQMLSGGTATGATVSNGGSETVFSGGIADATTVNSGGSEIVSAGGISNFTTVSAGGVLLYAANADLGDTTIGGDWTIASGVTVTIDAGTTTQVDQVGQHAPVLTISGGGELDVRGTLVMAGTVAGGTVRLEGTIDSATLASALLADGGGTATVDDVTIASGITLANGTVLLLNGTDQIGDGSFNTVDLGGNTLEVAGTLNLDGVTLKHGTLLLEPDATFNPGADSTLDDINIGGLLPGSGATPLSGQDVTLTTGYSLQSGETIFIQTGTGGSSGTFTVGSGVDLIGAGVISVSDNNGTSTAVIDGILIADVPGQTLQIAADTVIIDPAAEATNGATLEIGTTTATASTSTTLTGGPYVVGADSTLLLDNLGSVVTLGAVVTLDGTNTVFDANAGGDMVSLESSLGTIGGAVSGALNLLNGATFQAQNALTLSSSTITLLGAMLSAPSIVGTVYLGGGGGATTPILPAIIGSGTISAEIDGVGLTIAASGGSLELSGTVAASALLEAEDNASLTIDQALAAQNINSGPVDTLKLLNNATITMNDASVVPLGGITFAGTNSTIDMTGLQPGVTVAVSGSTLTNDGIDLTDVAAAADGSGNPEIKVTRKSSMLETVVITLSGGATDEFDISGNFASTGVTAGDDANNGTLIQFGPPPEPATPYVETGNGLTLEPGGELQFDGKIHQSLDPEDPDADPVATILITNGYQTNAQQGSLSGSVGGMSGALTAQGSFKGLQAGKDTNSLPQVDGEPAGISVSLNTANGGLVTGTVTIQYTSTAPSGGKSSKGAATSQLPDQTVTVQEQVYDYANAIFPQTTFYIRATTTFGDEQTLHLPITDDVPGDGYSEGLEATIVGSTGDFAGASGSVPLLPAGQTNSTDLNFTADTDMTEFGGRGGMQTGDIDVQITSDGDGTSELGQTVEGVVPVPVTVLFEQLATAYALMPQNFYIDSTNGPGSKQLSVTVANAAEAGVSENLVATIIGFTGDLAGFGGNYLIPDTGEGATIAAGQADQSDFSFQADTNYNDVPNGVNGAETGEMMIKVVSTGQGTDGGGITDLGTLDVPINVFFNGPAKPDVQSNYFTHATQPNAAHPSTTVLYVNVANDAPKTGHSDGLIATLAESQGDFSSSGNSYITANPFGTTPDILPGGTNASAIAFQVVTDANAGAAQQSGDFAFTYTNVPVNPPGGILGGNPNPPEQAVTINVQVQGYASPVIEGLADPPSNPYNPISGTPLFETIALGTVSVGSYLDHKFLFKNVATAPADNLGIVETVLGTNYSNTHQNYGTIVGGDQNSAPAIAPGGGLYYDGIVAQALSFNNVVPLGNYSETVQFTPLSENATSTTTLTPVDVTYTWTVARARTSATAWGDVHITTFDDYAYNFQAEGEFVLAKSTQAGNSFQVQVRLEPITGSSVTLITDLGVQVGSDKVTFEAGRTPLMYVNGVASTISPANAVIQLSGGTVTLVNGTYNFAWNTGETMTVTNAGTYLNVESLTLGPNDGPNSMEGLLGPANGGADQFQLADGSYVQLNPQGQISQTDLYGEFANSWRVTDATSLLDYTGGQTTANFTDLNFPADADAVSLDDLPAAVQTAALAAAAAAGITNPAIQQQAALDFALTGSSEFLSSGANAQQENNSAVTVSVAETPPPVPALGISAIATSTTEAASGATTLDFTVYLTASSSSITQVDYAVTVPGAGYLGAAAFGDTLPGGTVQIPIGSTSTTIQIAVPQGALGTDVSNSVQVTISSPGGNPIAAAAAETAVINGSPEAGAPPVPELAMLPGDATAVQNGSTLDVALGDVIQGQSIDALRFQITNGAAVPADNLAGTLADEAPGAFVMLGTATLPLVSPGASYLGLTAAVNTGTPGAGADIIDYDPTDENATGYTATLATQSIAFSDTVLAPAAALVNSPSPVVFAPVHVNDPVTPLDLSISNTAAAGSASLDAGVTIAEGGFGASGTISQLAPGATDDTSLAIAMGDSVAGAHTGNAVLSFTSDAGDGNTLALSTGTLALSGGVYRLALPSLPAIYLHAGGTGGIALPVVNTDPADGYSEALTGSVVGTTGGIVISGTVGTIAAGATSTSVGLTVPTSAAGIDSVTMDMVSYGNGIDGLGTTDLSDSTAQVFVNNYATAAFGEIGGGGSLSVAGTATTLDLGYIALGSGPRDVSLEVANSAAGPADLLSGQFSETVDTAFTNSGLANFQTLSAGGFDDNPEVSLSTAQTGTFSDTITLAATGSNPSGYSASLTTQTFAITGTVLAAPTVTQLAPTPSSGTVFPKQTISIAVGFSSPVTVGGAPTLSLNDGGSAQYVSGSGSETLVFSTTVKHGQNTPELAATALNLGGGDSIGDATSGLPVDLSGFNGAFTSDVAVNGGVACFVAGTRIATDRGDVAVEALTEGDRVQLFDGGFAPAVWIGHRHLECARHPDPALLQPIRIRANAVADGMPRRDVLVSPDHALFIDGKLIAARLLSNGASIVRESACHAVTYYHVELDRHAILLADGLPAESYLDTGNRGMFANGGEPLHLHPDFAGGQREREARSCAPFIDEPDAVEPVWRVLAARSGGLGWPLPEPRLSMDDPDLHLLVGGRRLNPVVRTGNVYGFVIPAGGGPVRLMSRTARPCAARPWVNDDRLLGVMISRLRVRQGQTVREIALDDPVLHPGWWQVERVAGEPCRWTNGDAVLPIAGPGVLEVELAGTLPYPAGGDARVRRAA